MAPNATAPKPVKVAALSTKSLRQPPSNTVWVRNHPWIEGVMGNIVSWSIHALFIVLAILFSLHWGFDRPHPQLPVEPVQFSDAGGGGSQEGSGDGPGGDHMAPKEDVEGPQDNASNTDKPTEDRPQLTPIQQKQFETDFPSADPRYIKEPTDSMRHFAELSKDLGDKLLDGINPSKGNGGTGKDGGTGSGKDKGVGSSTGDGKGRVLNEREKRMLRWSMQFNTRNGADYLHQLQALGAILAIPVGPGDQFKIIRDLSAPQLVDEDLSKIQRIWWIDDNPNSVHSLMQAMRLNLQPSRVVAFIPPEMEEELAKKELDFQHLPEDRIFETKFAVIPAGGGQYVVRVTDQKGK